MRTKRRSKSRLGDFVTDLPAAPAGDSRDTGHTEDVAEVEWFSKYERLRREGCRLSGVNCTGNAVASSGNTMVSSWVLRGALAATGVAIALGVVLTFVTSSDDSQATIAEVSKTGMVDASLGDVLQPSAEIAQAAGLDAGVGRAVLDAGPDTEHAGPDTEQTDKPAQKKTTKAKRFKRPTKRASSAVPFDDPLLITQKGEPPMLLSVSDNPADFKKAKYELKLDKYKGWGLELVHRKVRMVVEQVEDQEQ